MNKTEATKPGLPHNEGCPQERIETTDYADRGITTTHCCDCGAHVAQDRRGHTLAVPVSPGAFHNSARPADHGVSMEPTGGNAA